MSQPEHFRDYCDPDRAWCLTQGALQDFAQMPMYQRRQLPTGGAVYVVRTVDGVTLYVGETRNLRQRFQRHHRQKFFPENSVIHFHLTTRPIRWHMEWMFIKMFNPVFNGKHLTPRTRAVPERYSGLVNEWAQHPHPTTPLEQPIEHSA